MLFVAALVRQNAVFKSISKRFNFCKTVVARQNNKWKTSSDTENGTESSEAVKTTKSRLHFDTSFGWTKSRMEQLENKAAANIRFGVMVA